jgi:hypothetical protein
MRDQVPIRRGGCQRMGSGKGARQRCPFLAQSHLYELDFNYRLPNDFVLIILERGVRK